MDEWIEIVPALPLAEAETRFRDWKAERERLGEAVDEDQIRQDIICAEGGKTLSRYLIPRSASADRRREPSAGDKAGRDEP